MAPPPFAPRDLELPLLNGSAFKLADVLGTPVVFNVFDNRSGFSSCLWHLDDSIDELLHRGSKTGQAPASHFVFASHSTGAEADTASLAARFATRLAALDISDSDRDEWHKKLHFVTAPVAALPFVSEVLSAWPTSTDAATLHMPGGISQTIQRLDARYDWVGWNYNPSAAFGNSSLALELVGDGCELAGRSLTGKIALAMNTTKCDYFEQMQAAQRANASALVVAAADGQSLLDMNCIGAECSDVAVGMPATMISHAASKAAVGALQAGAVVRMSFATVEANGTDFLLAADGSVRQSWGGSGLGAGQIDGNPGDRSSKLYPRMAFLAWAGRAAVYDASLISQLATPAMVVPVFERVHLRPAMGDCCASTGSEPAPPCNVGGLIRDSLRPCAVCHRVLADGDSPRGCGPWAQVEVPAYTPFSSWHVDLRLGCNGSSDIDCPQWDHVVQLRACVLPSTAADARCNAQAGAEIGRWVTSFGRRDGRWLAEITPLAPLLSSANGAQSLNLTIYSAPWAGSQGAVPWVVTLSLRMAWKDQVKGGSGDDGDDSNGHSPEGEDAEVAPGGENNPADGVSSFTPDGEDAEVAPGGDHNESMPMVFHPWAHVTTESGGIGRVFRWVAFNQSFASFFPTYHFTLPRHRRRRVQLYAIITGHGNDNHGCGEFCATEHRFVVNRHAALIKRQLLPATDAQLGCAEAVDSGVVPNEYGTWYALAIACMLAGPFVNRRVPNTLHRTPSSNCAYHGPPARSIVPCDQHATTALQPAPAAPPLLPRSHFPCPHTPPPS